MPILLSIRSLRAARPGGDAPNTSLRETCDLIEADLTQTVRKVAGTSQAMLGNATQVVESVKAVARDAQQITEFTAAMHQSTSTVAAAVEELNASAREIQGQAAVAAGVAADATAAATNASDCMRALGQATERIGAVVSLIEKIASQTNLLALNATIEASRAGAAGRGFAVVAAEVKKLSSETRSATDDIRGLIEELRRSTRASVAAVEEVGLVNTRIEASAAGVQAAVAEQTSAIQEIARSAGEAAGEADAVDGRTRDIVARIDEAARLGGALGEQTRATSSAIEDLQRRLVIALRESPAGNRRRHDRLPTEEKGTLRAGGQVAPVVTVDLSEGGALLASLGGLPLAIGQRAALTLDGIGLLPVVLRGVSGLGAHLAFEEPGAEVRGRLAARLAAIVRIDAEFIDCAKDAARRIEAGIEAAIGAGRLSLTALFDGERVPIPGSDPVQFDHPALPVLARLLPPIQEPALEIDPRVVFCAAVDRSGYLPVHNRKYSQPQRPGEPVWNTANCRDRRIFDDRAGLLGARTTRPFLLQAYQRNMGGGQLVLMKEVDVPIHVRGKHWGAVRLAYRY